jgi:hypothetical protein
MVLSMSRPWKHPKTGVYWFRKVVPQAMRATVGKTEVRRSLRTKDPRQAALRHPVVAARVAAEWEALRRGPSAPDLARQFVQQLDDPAALAEDIAEADLRGAGVLDERALADGEWPARTPATQKAVSRIIERRGLASWIEGHLRGPLNQGQRAQLVEAVEVALLHPNVPLSAPPNNQSVFSLTGMLEGWWTEAKATEDRMRVPRLKTDSAVDGHGCGFLAYNTRATNTYREVEAMAYPMNVYQHGDVRSYFDERDIPTSEDLYAISTLVQWLWRSRIRKEPRESITVFLPSERMRGLFLEWLWSDSTKEFVDEKMDGARKALEAARKPAVEGRTWIKPKSAEVGFEAKIRAKIEQRQMDAAA